MKLGFVVEVLWPAARKICLGDVFFVKNAPWEKVSSLKSWMGGKFIKELSGSWWPSKHVSLMFVISLRHYIRDNLHKDLDPLDREAKPLDTIVQMRSGMKSMPLLSHVVGTWSLVEIQHGNSSWSTKSITLFCRDTYMGLTPFNLKVITQRSLVSRLGTIVPLCLLRRLLVKIPMIGDDF